jgi:hypothetical protein
MVHSIVLKFEKIWLSHTLNIIRKPKKSWSERELYALFLYSLVATLLFTIFKEFKKKKNIFFVTIAAIFHKRPGLATISLKVDHICIIFIKFGGNWLFIGF